VSTARYDNAGTHWYSSKRRKTKNILLHRFQVDENTWTWQRLGALRMRPHQGPCRSECQGGHAQLGICGTWCHPRLWAEAHTAEPLPWPFRTPRSNWQFAHCTVKLSCVCHGPQHVQHVVHCALCSAAVVLRCVFMAPEPDYKTSVRFVPPH